MTCRCNQASKPRLPTPGSCSTRHLSLVTRNSRGRAIIVLNYFNTKEARPMERRVVVTGMGAVSPLGLDVPTLWQGVQEARSGVGPVTLCDTEKLDSKIAGEVKGFDAQNYMDRKEVRRNDRF